MGTIQRATIEAKFTRASSLIADLSTRIENQIGALWATYEEPDPASQQIVTRFRVLGDLPHEWSTIVGYIVHNTRSALDLIAGKLVLLDGGSPTRSTQFPIGALEGYGKRLRHDLAGASLSTRDAVRALAPWPRGSSVLFPLHELDVLDKHHDLIALGGKSRGIQITMGIDDALTSFVLNAAERDVLVDGVALFARPADESNLSPFTMQHRPVVEVVFDVDTPLAGENVIDGLTRLVTGTRAEVDPLLARLG